MASRAGPPGTYVAWLADATSSAASRLTHTSVPCVRPDRTRVANNWKDLTNGNLLAPIEVGPLGVLHTNAVWTDTTGVGKAITGAPVCTNGCRYGN